MSKNNSYGKYGGVSNSNHYVPPSSPSFVPQPANINLRDRVLAEQLMQKMQFYTDNAPNILLRRTVSSLSGNIDSFVMTTSGRPEDQIVYTSNKDVVNIDPNTFDNIVDGGYF